MLTWT
jgi:NADH dehydrogenase FAD-containing subunit